MANTAPQAAQLAPAPPPVAAGHAAAAAWKTFGRRLLLEFVGIAALSFLLFILNGLLDLAMVSDPPPFRIVRWFVVSLIVVPP